jgi:hypothetical protein
VTVLWGLAKFERELIPIRTSEGEETLPLGATLVNLATVGFLIAHGGKIAWIPR